MDRAERDVLRRVPLFASLSEAHLDEIAAVCSERRFNKGDVVWRAGDLGDELLVITSGQLDVYGSDGEGGQRLLAELGPGECAGELALLLDEARSATLTCARASRVLVLAKPDFRALVGTDSRVLSHLTELLSRRAVSAARGRPIARSTTTVVVVADDGVPGASLVASAIASLTPVVSGHGALLVRSGEHGLPTGPTVGPGALVESVNALVGTRAGQHRLIVVDLPGPPSGGIADLAEAFDVVVHVTTRVQPADQSAAARILRVVNRRHPEAPTLPIRRCEPFVLPDEPALHQLRGEAAAALLVDTPDLPAARVLRRLTRKVLGATVGVALGAGAAFGIAHVGVFAALEDAGIEADLVAGASMGSIVAIGYGAGLTGHDMTEIARRIGNKRTTMSVLQPSLTGTGLLNGRRLASIFGPLLPHDTFEELVVPTQVVAMDVETGERVEIGTGRLDDAFRASCAIPLVFTPVRLEGRTLVDGGMVDPVPAEVVRAMGADVVVGVNVSARPSPDTSTAISRTFKQINRMNPLSYLSGARDMPDIVDVLMNSIQVVQHELGEFKGLSADVRVDVDLAGFTWLEFWRATELVERGRAAGERAIDDIRAALDRQLTNR